MTLFLYLYTFIIFKDCQGVFFFIKLCLYLVLESFFGSDVCPHFFDHRFGCISSCSFVIRANVASLDPFSLFHGFSQTTLLYSSTFLHILHERFMLAFCFNSSISHIVYSTLRCLCHYF